MPVRFCEWCAKPLQMPTITMHKECFQEYIQKRYSQDEIIVMKAYFIGKRLNRKESCKALTKKMVKLKKLVFLKYFEQDFSSFRSYCNSISQWGLKGNEIQEIKRRVDLKKNYCK